MPVKMKQSLIIPLSILTTVGGLSHICLYASSHLPVAKRTHANYFIFLCTCILIKVDLHDFVSFFFFFTFNFMGILPYRLKFFLSQDIVWYTPALLTFWSE